MKRNERGFLTLELLASLSIGGLVAAGAAVTTVQLIQVSEQTEDHATTVRQAQAVGTWGSQDLLMARTLSTADDLATPETEFAIISWKDWETGAMYEVRYSWTNTPNDGKKVVRKQTIHNKSGQLTNTVTTLVADNIASANVSPQADVTWALNVESLAGRDSTVRQYGVKQRIQ